MNVRTMLAGVAAAALCSGASAGSLYTGLAAYYTFDEATPANHAPGTTVTGLTLSGGDARSGASDAECVHAGFGGYLDLAGGWARLEGSQNLSFANGNDFTVVVWMRAEASQTGDTRDPVFFGNGNWYGGAGPKQPGVVLAMYYNTTHTDGVSLNYSYLDGATAARTRLNTYPVPLGAWTFYAVSHTSDGKMRFYRSSAAGALTVVAENDVPDFTLAYDNAEDRRPFYLGQDGTGAYTLPFTGKIDEFALWTRGLDPEDVNAVYRNGRRARPLERLLMPSVSAGDETAGSVTVTIEGEHPGGWTLCVGSGAEDAGADRFAWDHLDTVATISASDSSYTYTLPAEFASEGRYYRFFLSKASLAQYQEIEYVANAAWNPAEAAYLGTGFLPTRDTTVSTEVEIDDYSTYDNIFGCCDRSTYWFYHLGFFQTQWYTEITKYEHAAHSFTTKFGSAAVGDRCAFVYGIRGVSYWDGKTDGAGTWQALLNNPTGFPDGEVALDLFRCPKPDGTAYDKSFVGKMYYLSVATTNAVVRDYVPAKNQAGVAGFYDLAEGAFRTSSSSVPFVAGPAASGRLCAQTATAKARAAGDPVTAYWVGGPGARLDSPSNWHCEDETGLAVVAVPQSFTAVSIADAGEMFSVPAGTAFACKSIAIGGSVALNGDVDWRGVDFSKVTAAGPLDLAGHSFAILAEENPGDALAYTDTVGGGELHVEVPDGKTVVNTKLALSGAATLVKDGDGTFVANRQNQSNTGGVRVDGGVLMTTAFISTRVLGPAGSKIEIGPYGTLTVENGYTGLEDHDLVLAGGVLHMKNSELLAGRSAIGSLTQTADSTIRLETTQADDGKCDTEAADGAIWDLGGRMLTVEFLTQASDFMLGRGKSVKPVFRNGTINLSSSVGYWHDEGIDATNGVTYVYGMTYVRQQNTAKVLNFVNNIPSNASVGNGGPLCIYGTYTPNSDTAMRLRMMNGSTLDLEGRSGAWPVALGGEGDLARTMDWESNATVRVWLGGRVLGAENRKIVSWDERPAGIHFVDKGKKWTMMARPDGLYVQKGFCLAVQ